MATVEQLIAEAYRLRLLRSLDTLLHDHGFPSVAGVDEVGRGCLAGPVVAAAVVADPRCLVPGVDDSKALSAERREALAAEIRANAIAWSVVPVSPAVIDRINILQATRLAMSEALAALKPPPGCALVDAVRLEGLPFPVFSLVKGDALSYAIASASIVAKVERDRLMRELDGRYPHYGFAKHKGYGAQRHRDALAVHGPCPAHRLTFRSVVPRLAEATA